MNAEQPVTPASTPWKVVLRNTAYILAALLIFLFALDLMISSLQHLGQDAADVIILATSNPFTGLFIGLLVTAIIQSSSATTAMAVALMASGSMTLGTAIPIIMGANVGTTITSTIVSLGFITSKKEFRRAVTIGTYHDFFNILTVIVLFPLEYYFGFLSGLAQYLGSNLFNEPLGNSPGNFSLLGWGFGSFVKLIVTTINNEFVLIVLSVVLLFSSILFFRRVISKMLGIQQERFQHFFFENSLKSFGWGLLITAIIRSSTVTTSLVVPLAAKKIVKIKAAVPFVLGANIGTTITAFIAALFNSNAAISVAIAHFLFNAIGVILFYLVPVVKELPLKLADGLGRLTLKYRLAGFLYLLLTFFVIPFSLIYFNKDAVLIHELTYQQQNLITQQSNTYKIVSKMYPHHIMANMLMYKPPAATDEDLSQILTVYRRNNLLIINNELFELNRSGFCRDAEDDYGKYKNCILHVVPTLTLAPGLAADSVFVFEKQWYQPERVDSTRVRLYVSAALNLVVKKEKVDVAGRIIEQEFLIALQSK
ncbi:MAG: Na/Pi cotransporter family protein [Cytophagales bacterium]|nr:Na/Pi cotransporter family protein [Cytophagales bacterium]